MIAKGIALCFHLFYILLHLILLHFTTFDCKTEEKIWKGSFPNSFFFMMQVALCVIGLSASSYPPYLNQSKSNDSKQIPF